MRLLQLKFLLSTLTLLPGVAAASAAPDALAVAMDLNPSMLQGAVLTPGTSTTMFDVRSQLGPFTPQNVPTMALLSTGNVDNITQMQDYDYPGAGGDTSAGDHVTFEFDLLTPQYANSFSFNFNFLSREYPEWVGSAYNDTFEVWLTSTAYTGQIVFDAFGNPVTVNNALFTVTNPGSLVGTGFDQDGATGWVTTIAPCDGGEVMHISFQIYDVADGVWDSSVLIDNFSFSEDPPPGDGPWTGDDTPETPINVYFLSPKEGDLQGGSSVTLYGINFTPDITAYVGAAQVTDLTVGAGGDSLTLGTIPDSSQAGAGAEGGPVDITLIRGPEEVVLGDSYTYWDPSGGDVPPRVTSVTPPSANPSGGTDLRIRGQGFVDGATVQFVADDGTSVEGEVAVVQPVDGGAEIIVATPTHDEAWVQILVTNPNGLISDPGYPFLFTVNAAAPPGDDSGGTGRDCNQTGTSASPLMLLVLGLGLGALRRRQS